MWAVRSSRVMLAHARMDLRIRSPRLRLRLAHRSARCSSRRPTRPSRARAGTLPSAPVRRASNTATTLGQSTVAACARARRRISGRPSGRRASAAAPSTKARASPRRHQHAGFAIGDVDAGRRVVVGDDDQAARHRLERDVPERLRLAREQEDVGRGVVGGQLLARAHPAEDEIGMRPLELAAQWSVADDHAAAPAPAPAASPGTPRRPAGRSSPARAVRRRAPPSPSLPAPQVAAEPRASAAPDRTARRPRRARARARR